MAYSDQSDLLDVLPDCTGYVDSSLDAASYFDRQRAWAASVIDDKIQSITVTPSSEDLSEIEANLVAYRLLRQNFASRDMDSSREFVKQYYEDAMRMLHNHVFPATVTSATKMLDFSTYAGSGAITIAVNDLFTYTAKWLVKCITAGSSTAVFEIWNEKKGTVGCYELANDNQFPDEDHIDAASPRGLIKEIKITITSDDSNPYSLGDTWSFKTYAKRKLKTKQGIKSIPIRRF